MAALAPAPKFYEHDSNGAPLAGGLVYTYLTNTTTPLATYTDSGGGTANANPVVLDSAGRANIWLLTTSLYKFVVKTSAGVTIYTVNDIGASATTVSMAQSSGANAIGFSQSASYSQGTVGLSLQRFVSVKDAPFNAVGNGTADDTSAIQAAINFFASGKGTVFFPPGSYKITSTLTVAQDRIHLVGAGRWASSILFAPSAADTALHFTKGASVLYQCSLSNLAFTSNDTTYTKTAIDISDVSALTISDVVVGPLWTGGTGCIGLHCHGREATVIERVELYTERPILISDNPNSFIDIDHWIFRDIYIIAAASGVPSSYACIQVESGVNLSNVTFEGYQAWVYGAHGFYWVDTTSSGNSQFLTIKNARWEGATNATGKLIDIEHNGYLQTLRVENASGGLNTLGIKLRKIKNASIVNTVVLNTSGNAMDVDSTVQPLILDNFFSQSGSTISTGTLKKVFDSGVGSNGGTSGAYVIYALPSTINPVVMDIPLMGSIQSVAQDAAISVGVAAQTQGFLFVCTSEDVSAIYCLSGGSNSVVEVSDPFGFFTPTKDNAGTYNVYYDSSNYYVQNKRTGSKNISYFIVGTNI